jgi:hypothetical protein
MARSACAVPNFAKEKGKFLLIFPGNFSFRTATTTQSGDDPSGKTIETEIATVPGAAAVTQSDGDEDGKPSPVVKEENNEDQSSTHPVAAMSLKKTATPVSSATPPLSSSAAATTMGRIEGLRTNNPSFRIPFPHLQKSLVFKGKKITTTSKYLALSCSNKKNGTVQCKVRMSVGSRNKLHHQRIALPYVSVHSNAPIEMCLHACTYG